MKKLLVLLSLVLVMSTALVIAKPAGYNWNANVFVGTGLQWCMQKFSWNETQCRNYLGVYADDQLVMKWNMEWNRGNAEGWLNPPYDAYLNNEWNGMCDGCSGEVWHYMIKWVGLPCDENNQNWQDGGYCIWGQFEVLMDQGTVDGEHIWGAHAIPTGYGGP